MNEGGLKDQYRAPVREVKIQQVLRLMAGYAVSCCQFAFVLTAKLKQLEMPL